MNPLDDFDLDAADVKRIDEILSIRTGRGLFAEVARSRRRRIGLWIALILGILLISVAGYYLGRSAV